MPVLDLGPENRLPALAASHFDRASVRNYFKVRLDRAPEQRRLRLMGAARLASQCGVNLRGEF